MTPEPYRVAYETALAEITEIAAKFEQLRTRKGQIENLIAVLQPIFADAPEGVSAVPLPQQTAGTEETPIPQLLEAIETPAADEPTGYSYLNVPNPLPTGDGDPFERRVKTSFRFRGLAAQRSY